LLVLLNQFIHGLSVGCHGHRIDLKKPLPGFNSALFVLEIVQQDNTLVEPGIFLLGIELYDPVEQLNCFFGIAAAAIHNPQVGKNIGVVRRELK
jgi:hypothetical protein